MMKTTALLASAAALAMPSAVAAAPRADATQNPNELLAQLTTAFEEFRSKNDEHLAAKVDDVVLREHVDRINDTIANLEESIDRALAQQAAAAGQERPLRDAEYTAEFEAYFQGGVTSARLEEVKATATKTDGEGGYLAPVEWDRTITDQLKQISLIRQYASVQRISGAGFSKVFNNRSIGSGWVGEEAARPETGTPTLTSLQFPLGEIYANPAATQGLLDDAEVDVEAWLASEVETEFARQEGIAFLSGDGSNKPHGLLGYVTGGAHESRHPWGAIETVSSGAASALTGDGLIDLIYELPEEFEANARLFVNRDTARRARKLKDGQGNYLWQPSYQAGEPATLGGAPVVHMPGMPTVAANAIAALYGDMRECYQVIDRIGIRVLRDPYTNKPYVHFYTTKRVGGGVKNPEAMKALKIETGS